METGALCVVGRGAGVERGVETIEDSRFPDGVKRVGVAGCIPFRAVLRQSGVALVSGVTVAC